jgi:hypothetical protein
MHGTSSPDGQQLSGKRGGVLVTNTRCRRAIYLASGWVGDHLRDALQGIRHGHWYLEGQSVAALPGTYREPGRPGPTLSFGTPTPCTCVGLHGACCMLNVVGSMLHIVRCALHVASLPLRARSAGTGIQCRSSRIARHTALSHTSRSSGRCAPPPHSCRSLCLIKTPVKRTCHQRL